ncbi:very short patch repair endonuclease [Geobacter anodireducens]
MVTCQAESICQSSSQLTLLSGAGNTLRRLAIDIWEKSKRSAVMARIRSKDTKPEMVVRTLVFSMGFRYRLHNPNLPGKPDLAFTRKKKAIFVHGCFWHLHEGCKISKLPKSNEGYWHPKLEKNRARDLSNQAKLHELGWDYLVIWECEIKNLDDLKEIILRFLT